MLYGMGTRVDWTPLEGVLRLRLCEASGWCQSVDTAWDSDAEKWLCAACARAVDRGPMGERHDEDTDVSPV